MASEAARAGSAGPSAARRAGSPAGLVAMALVAAACGGPLAPSPVTSAPVSDASGATGSRPPAALAAELDPLMRSTAELVEEGLVISVISAGETWTGVAGHADRSTGREVTPDTVFAIGSVTKTMMAALVLRLAEDGEVDLDAPIAAYLPSDLSALGNGATVRDVLAHRSGIADYQDDPVFRTDVVRDPDRTWTNRDALRYVGDSAFDAGAGWQYSNTNYVLLDVLVEGVAGRPTGEVMDELLFEPHDLDRIAFQPTERPAEPTAVGYADLDGDGAPETLEGGGLLPTRAIATAAGGSGAAAADAPSAARWARLLYGGEVLAPESLEAMLDFGDGDGEPYGLGASQVRYTAELDGLGHRGVVPGFHAAVVHVPRIDVTAAAMTNGDFVDGQLDPMTLVRPFVLALAD